MIIIKQVILINYHEFLINSELINFISFLKDTGKIWDIFLSIYGLWNLDT